MGRIVLFLVLGFTFSTSLVFAGNIVRTKPDLILPYKKYSKLTGVDKVNYMQDIRRLYLAFEKQYWSVKKVSLLDFLESTAYAAKSKWLRGKCTVGGRVISIDSRGLCPTFGLSCGKEKDTFLCGQIYYSACIKRLPWTNISERCNTAAEQMESADTSKAISADVYGKIKAILTDALTLCGAEIPSACDILKIRLNKVNQEFNKESIVSKTKCIPIEFESQKSMMASMGYHFSVKIEDKNKTWIDEDGILSMLALKHKIIIEASENITENERQFMLKAYQDIVEKGNLKQTGCSDETVKESIRGMQTVLSAKEKRGLFNIESESFNPLDRLSDCMTFARPSGKGNERSNYNQIFLEKKYFDKKDISSTCGQGSYEEYVVRGPWEVPSVNSNGAGNSKNDSTGSR